MLDYVFISNADTERLYTSFLTKTGKSTKEGYNVQRGSLLVSGVTVSQNAGASGVISTSSGSSAVSYSSNNSSVEENAYAESSTANIAPYSPTPSIERINS